MYICMNTSYRNEETNRYIMFICVYIYVSVYIYLFYFCLYVGPGHPLLRAPGRLFGLVET